MAFRADCSEDRSTDVRGVGGARDYLASTYPPAEADSGWTRYFRGQRTRSCQPTTSANTTDWADHERVKLSSNLLPLTVTYITLFCWVYGRN